MMESRKSGCDCGVCRRQPWHNHPDDPAAWMPDHSPHGGPESLAGMIGVTIAAAIVAALIVVWIVFGG